MRARPAPYAGLPVDWFVILKKNDTSNGYFYADATRPSFTLSPFSLNNNTNGAAANTIVPALNHSIAMYNDQPPGRTLHSRRCQRIIVYLV